MSLNCDTNSTNPNPGMYLSTGPISEKQECAYKHMQLQSHSPVEKLRKL